MNPSRMIGYDQALRLTVDSITPLTDQRTVDLAEAGGRVLFRDIRSQVDSPSIDASMKDGYAVQSRDIARASQEAPVVLTVTGTAAAGHQNHTRVSEGTAIRILTGGRLPEGADAVLAEEFSALDQDRLTVFNTAGTGRNILPKGSDVAQGEVIAQKGTVLTPGLIGLLAAAGIAKVPVFRRPCVAILATGDELVPPGAPLPEGKLYASNLEMLKAWCRKLGLPFTCIILEDKPDLILDQVKEMAGTHDALMSSGGAWTGDRDFMATALEQLGWEKKFQYIRMGPGKPVGFGHLGQKPFFILPGGPPSNLTAFLMIALPGLRKLAGHTDLGLPRITVSLDQRVKARHRDWTHFVYGTLDQAPAAGPGSTRFTPLKLASRLKSMALSQAVIAVPEGKEALEPGTLVPAQILF